MSENPNLYNPIRAQAEAAEMQKKIKSGEAKDYKQAARLIDNISAPSEQKPEDKNIAEKEFNKREEMIKVIMEHEGINNYEEAEKTLKLIEEVFEKQKAMYLSFYPTDPQQRSPTQNELFDYLNNLRLDNVYTGDKKNLPIFEIIAHSFMDKKGYKEYNNFWKYLQRSYAMSSPEKFFEINGKEIEARDEQAKTILGDFYTGPIEIKQDTTIEDVANHYKEMVDKYVENNLNKFFINSAETRNKTKGDGMIKYKNYEKILKKFMKVQKSGKFPERELANVVFLGDIIGREYIENERKATETDETCKEMGYINGIVDAYNEYAAACGFSGNPVEFSRGSPELKRDTFPAGATGLEIILKISEKYKKIGGILKPIFEGLVEKGYSEDELFR